MGFKIQFLRIHIWLLTTILNSTGRGHCHQCRDVLPVSAARERHPHLSGLPSSVPLPFHRLCWLQDHSWLLHPHSSLLRLFYFFYAFLPHQHFLFFSPVPGTVFQQSDNLNSRCLQIHFFHDHLLILTTLLF